MRRACVASYSAPPVLPESGRKGLVFRVMCMQVQTKSGGVVSATSVQCDPSFGYIVRGVLESWYACACMQVRLQYMYLGRNLRYAG